MFTTPYCTVHTLQGRFQLHTLTFSLVLLQKQPARKTMETGGWRYVLMDWM